MILYLDKKNKNLITKDWARFFSQFKIASDLYLVRKINEYTIDGIYLKCSGSMDQHYHPIYFITPLFEMQMGSMLISNYLKDGLIDEYVRMSFHADIYHNACEKLILQNRLIEKSYLTSEEFIQYLTSYLNNNEHFLTIPAHFLITIAYIMKFEEKDEDEKNKFLVYADRFMGSSLNERYWKGDFSKVNVLKKINIILFGSITKDNLNSMVETNMPKILK